MSGKVAARVVGSEILDQDDREYELVDVPVWKGQARVQSLNAAELFDVIEHGGTNVGLKLIALCQVDAEGRQVFRAPDAPILTITDTDAMTAAVERVKQKNPKAINALADALIKINGITMKAPDAGPNALPPVDEIKNDSGETPTGVSPTASPSKLDG